MMVIAKLFYYQVDIQLRIVKKYCQPMPENDRLLMMEFVLHGLAEYSVIGKSILDSSITFGDMMNQIFSSDDEDEQED